MKDVTKLPDIYLNYFVSKTSSLDSKEFEREVNIGFLFRQKWYTEVGKLIAGEDT